MFGLCLALKNLERKIQDTSNMSGQKSKKKGQNRILKEKRKQYSSISGNACWLFVNPY